MNSEEIQIVEYDDSHKKEWDNFVENSSNGTVFHKQVFLDYHDEGKFNFNHLLFFKEDKLISVLPGGLVGDMFKSPMGASFGGLVINKNMSLYDADRIVKALIYYCSREKIKEIYLTPPMQIYHETFNEAVIFAMYYNHFIQITALYSSVIDFSLFHDKNDLSKNTRHKINKAINKGIIIKENKDYDTFYPILLENKKKFGVFIII